VAANGWVDRLSLLVVVAAGMQAGMYPVLLMLGARRVSCQAHGSAKLPRLQAMHDLTVCCPVGLLAAHPPHVVLQECFTAAYTAFEPQAMQYSSGGNPIYAAPAENKYDPKAEQSAKVRGRGQCRRNCRR
jgi:hypothetical protein